jgi:hypothetical protein
MAHDCAAAATGLRDRARALRQSFQQAEADLLAEAETFITRGDDHDHGN